MLVSPTRRVSPQMADKKGEGYLPPKYTVPFDSEGYVQSFSLDQPKEYKEFFEKYGFAVVNGVLSEKECEETIDDIWAHILKTSKGVDRNNPATWSEDNWRTSGIYSEGLIGGSSLFSPTLLQNRQNPNVHKVFSVLLGREDLLVNQDRYGFFRASKEVKLPDGTVKDFPERRTMRNLHLDMNPWAFTEDQTLDDTNTVLHSLRYVSSMDWIVENNHPGVANPKYFQLNTQGLLNLADNKIEDGGLQLVPGFCHHICEWARNTTSTYLKLYGKHNSFIMLDPSDPIHEHAIRTSSRAGALIVWDQRTIHGSVPNNSSRSRFAQFFKMFPANINPKRAKARADAIKKKLKDCKYENKVTPLGAKVFGITPYK